jgi:hypothetical protein
MRKSKRHKQFFILMPRQKGMALLILLSLILIAVTAVAVSHLSLNTQSINRAKNTTQALAYSKNILLGYAMIQTVPGTLPCPDITNDGYSDPPTGACASYRGLLPYKTLGITKQADGSGQLLWYVVDRNYVGVISPHNNTQTASLRINGALSYAFIVIAPNTPLLGQSPDLTLLNATQFLEGENANNTLDTYSSLKDDTHNDSLLGVTTLNFWMEIE